MIAPVMPEKNRKPAVSSPAQRCSLPNIALIVSTFIKRLQRAAPALPPRPWEFEFAPARARRERRERICWRRRRKAPEAVEQAHWSTNEVGSL